MKLGQTWLNIMEVEQRAIIQDWTVTGDKGNFLVHVIMEDRFTGGTKRRALKQFIQNNYSDQDELVFFCSKSSLAQLALAVVVKELRRLASIFISGHHTSRVSFVNFLVLLSFTP